LARSKLILLDTHVLIWWANGDLDRLSAPAKSAIDAAGPGELAISAISTWEIAMLVAHGRLILAADVSQWIGRVGQLPAIRFVPIDNDIALESVALPPPFHKDPADRMIVATARRLGSPLVTANDKIQHYAHVRTIW
jgi:PIN domain nuclease of toxin-antitoxin system